MLANKLPLSFSISACSRQKRENEINGKDYHFLSIEDFKQKINEQTFIEWEEVYENNYYGTLKSEIERIWNDKKHVVFDVDVVGGLNLKKHFGNNALAIFIQPPSMDVLIERLRNRATESEASLNKRINKAKHEMTYSPSFDSIIINDQLEKTIEVAEKKVKDFKLMKKIGLYFGTFNPIHVGHLIIANYMADYTELDEVWLVVILKTHLKRKHYLKTIIDFLWLE